MKRSRVVRMTGGWVVLAGLIWAATHFWSGERLAAAEPSHPPIPAGQLRIAPDSPQRAYLRIEPVHMTFEPASPAFPARVTYDENATARVSSPVSGRVTRIEANAGDNVRAGQPLAWLESPEVGAAGSDWSKARAELAQKRASFERAKVLYEGEVLARKDYESARADFDEAQAEFRRVTLRMSSLGLGKNPLQFSEQYPLRTPVSGTVVRRELNPGTEVHPDAPNPLFVITDPARVWVVADLPDTFAGHVKVGQKVELRPESDPHASFVATVKQIGVAIDPETRRLPVRCELDGKNSILRPDMLLRATLLTADNRRVIQVPNSAVVTMGLKAYAFVERVPGTIERREIRISRVGPESSVVAEGLEAGDRVITSGAMLLNSELADGA